MADYILLRYRGKGRWLPTGPDNDRACVFTSGAKAMQWAREAIVPESFSEDCFKLLEIPTWPMPESVRAKGAY